MKKAKTRDDWSVLKHLIDELESTARADELKGGGDPADYDSIEHSFKLTKSRLQTHLQQMQDKYK